MIIRNLKRNIRQQIIPQSSVYEQQDHTIEEVGDNHKRTLNPQLPISETIVSKQQSFYCEPTQPLFDKNNQKQAEKKVQLSQEKPLLLEQNISQSIKRQLQNQQSNIKRHQPIRRWHIGVHTLRQRTTQRKRNMEKIQKLFKEQPLHLNQENKLDKKIECKSISIGNWNLNIPEITEIKAIKQAIAQKNKRDQESIIPKSKFNKSVVRQRLSQTLNKFRSSEQKSQNTTKQRYTYNSLDDKSESSNQFNTAISQQIDSNSKKMIFEYIKSKAEQTRVSRIVKKIIPGDSQSTEQRYSTIFQNSERPKVSDSDQEISPKGYFQSIQKSKQKITISYKTTLLELKELCARQDLDQQEVTIMVPQALSSVAIQQNSTQEEIFKIAKNLVDKLNIVHVELNIKKYSNCIIIICDNKAIIYYYSGKIYIGGWNCGQKMGLGLQLNPGKSVYYGEFRNNKRQGVGIYKGIKGQIRGGNWKDNHFEGNKVSKANFKFNKKSFLQNDQQED